MLAGDFWKLQVSHALEFIIKYTPLHIKRLPSGVHYSYWQMQVLQCMSQLLHSVHDYATSICTEVKTADSVYPIWNGGGSHHACYDKYNPNGIKSQYHPYRGSCQGKPGISISQVSTVILIRPGAIPEYWGYFQTITMLQLGSNANK